MTILYPASERLASAAGADELFHRHADRFVSRLRTSMGVPPQADNDVELELDALRVHLDTLLPEFRREFGRLLNEQLENAQEVVELLEMRPLQSYVKSSEQIGEELRELLFLWRTKLQCLAVRLSEASQIARVNPDALNSSNGPQPQERIHV